MSPTSIAALGAIAGVTIFIGLPVGRVRNAAPRTRALLNAAATGILVFLVWDVLTHAWEPIDAALTAREMGTAGGFGAVLAVAFTLGLMGLVYLDRWIARRARRPVLVGHGVPVEPVPGALSPAAAHAQRLAMMIAVGIGLHNFAEGLAIGSSAASGALQLAVLLVIGFALHNATEGFGIVAPLAVEGYRPSWGYLGVLGLIGGGPTFVGTLVGQRFTSDLASVAFLALAAGSILYVVVELLAVARRIGFKELTTWGLVIGVLLGFATDAIVTAAGA
ncbi:MAG TPA: ZIP family metal transporter [Cellulomonas sp.]|uniref:ZIP family metal transporter n=1 Tax=Cellulomonas sp. TaxID=40001 RepID=UPI002E32C138|nr:ZIP family metal transporter [Cellulomonas sp.]HEX5333920.1 ZIP family metal transporter [Cellulomonas sp.]